MALKTLSIKDFTGGRNSRAASPTLEANESLDQWNTWCENNALVKRRGYTSIDSTINSIGSYIIKMCLTPLGTTGANRLVMMSRTASTTAGSSRLIYTDNGSTLANCEATPTAFSGASVPFMGMFMGKLYVSDGVNSAVSYDGTTVATVAAFPEYSKCAVHKNYIFAIKGRILSWCDINDATTWPANNFTTVNSDGGDVGIAIKSIGGGLLIFMRHSMYLFVGDIFDPIEAQYYLQKIDTPPNFDFCFGQTVVTHQGVIKFLTIDGFYAYTGGAQIIKISDAIQPDVDSLLSTATYDTTNDLELPDSFPKSFVWKNCLYTSILISGSNRRLFVQDEKGKWWFWMENSYGSGPLEVASANLGSGFKLYAGMPKDKLFLTLDTGYALGVGAGAIWGYWISKDFNFPNESQFKYADIFLKKQAAVATLGTLVFSISIDGGTFVDFNIDMMNGVGTILKKRIPILRIGRSIRVKVFNSELGVTFEVYQINVIYEPTTAMR